MSDALTALTIVTALGCALNGGVFFAFSTFVMQGLGRLTPSQRYLREWTAANHVRTVTGLVAAGALMPALVAG